MVHSHSMGMRPGMQQGLVTVGSDTLCSNFCTDLRQEQKRVPIVSYSASPAHCITLGFGPVQWESVITWSPKKEKQVLLRLANHQHANI